METETVAPQRNERGWFLPGNTANPHGRPKGSKDTLREDFVAALQRDFRAHGEGAISKCREEQPSVYLNVVAKIVAASMPRDLNVKGDALMAFVELWEYVNRSANGVARGVAGERQQPEALRLPSPETGEN